MKNRGSLPVQGSVWAYARLPITTALMLAGISIGHPGPLHIVAPDGIKLTEATAELDEVILLSCGGHPDEHISIQDEVDLLAGLNIWKPSGCWDGMELVFDGSLSWSGSVDGVPINVELDPGFLFLTAPDDLLVSGTGTGSVSAEIVLPSAIDHLDMVNATGEIAVEPGSAAHDVLLGEIAGMIVYHP